MFAFMTISLESRHRWDNRPAMKASFPEETPARYARRHACNSPLEMSAIGKCKVLDGTSVFFLVLNGIRNRSGRFTRESSQQG